MECNPKLITQSRVTSLERLIPWLNTVWDLSKQNETNVHIDVGSNVCLVAIFNEPSYNKDIKSRPATLSEEQMSIEALED